MNNDVTPLLRFAGVSAGYSGSLVLKDVDFAVFPGDFIALTGPNGGGKTTLVRLMLRLMKPRQGVVERRRGLIVGYQPQYQRIDRQFPVTVREIVLSGLNCRKPYWCPFTARQEAHVERVLEECGVAEFRHRLVSELSGGQLQRVLFARAVVADPDLLVLDEPDTYLDAVHRDELYCRLRELNRRCAVVLVTHNPAAIAYDACRTVHVDGVVTERTAPRPAHPGAIVP